MTATTPWKTAKRLRTESDRLMYLLACLEEAPDDPVFFTHARGAVTRSRRMWPVKRKDRLTVDALLAAVAEMGDPGFVTVSKAAGAMGYQMTAERCTPDT